MQLILFSPRGVDGGLRLPGDEGRAAARQRRRRRRSDLAVVSRERRGLKILANSHFANNRYCRGNIILLNLLFLENKNSQ